MKQLKILRPFYKLIDKWRHRFSKKTSPIYYRHITRSGTREHKIYIYNPTNYENQLNKETILRTSFSSLHIWKIFLRYLKDKGIIRLYKQDFESYVGIPFNNESYRHFMYPCNYFLVCTKNVNRKLPLEILINAKEEWDKVLNNILL